MAMCNDMRRFERMAEEKKRSKKEKEVEFLINGIEKTPLTSKTEAKTRTGT